MKNINLLLFCNYNPFSSLYTESVFISDEIVLLRKHFDNVDIIPTMNAEGRCSADSRVIADYVKRKNKPNYLKIIIYSYYSLFSSFFYHEILKQPSLLFNLKKIIRLVKFLGIAYDFNKWLKNYIKCNNISLDSLILYTYWFCPITFGCALLKKQNPNLTVVSRAHGFDLYAERQKVSYKPCRSFLLSLIDKVYAVSDHGKNYLTSKYLKYSNKIETARLGTSVQNFSCKASTDGIFRVVSCSSIVPVKRIPFLAKILCKVAIEVPDKEIIWNHIGAGVEMEKLKEETQFFPDNLKYVFHGNIPNTKVLLFYKNNPVDIFINVSSSEGLPVSIMEAQSCSIPVAATSVGGIPEIVNNDNGFLLPEEADIITISKIIIASMHLPIDELKTKRLLSKKMHRGKCNFENNFIKFVNNLKNTKS